ncbi:hypothetical protein ODJ79_19540 [Actinoplanes sp. KI2]|uniref:hypothetical protein n=1 Tax=Actinoplanes sp. KI2 TaxID=2983315 RepID=UPI0021D5C7AB|nr:hypothetical protein [Actinoplanes sp. KI2]MCU7725925.1 hypothetical protein [Actinoplanes sp. KI2]
MVDVEELLDGVPVRLAPAQTVRARGERRRARQGVGLATAALVAVTAVGVGTWTQVAPGTHGTAVATADAADGVNPFERNGVVKNLKPSDLPKNSELHWQVDYHNDGFPPPLPQAGLNGACDGWPGGIAAPQQQFTSSFTGKDDARARYRVSQYGSPGEAQGAVRGLGQTLHDCGLTENADDGSYRGRANTTGPWLEVSVQRWEAWVGVTEVQYRP